MKSLLIPEEILCAGAALFDKLPLGEAMSELVPSRPRSAILCDAVNELVLTEPFSYPELSAGLWLYVDELERSHRISQGLSGATGAFWHGIMHRREGDFGNSHYWFHRVGRHPAMAWLPGYDPHEFIDMVAKCYKENPLELVALQRWEWVVLFTWCWERIKKEKGAGG